MKKILPIILLLTAIATKGQQLTMTKVELRITDCRPNAYHYDIDTIAFYRLPQDTFAFTAITPRHFQQPIWLNNIPVANYQMVFKNRFGQTVSKQVSLKNKSTQVLTICMDSLQEYGQNTLSKLQQGDSIVINFTSNGCFHWNEFKLVMIKEAGDVVAKLYDVNGSSLATRGKRQHPLTGPVLIKTAILSGQQLSGFIRFENELHWMGSRGCTTTDYYEVTSKYWNTKKVDGSCHWNGFKHLRQSFFGKEK